MSEARALLKLSDGSEIRFGADESDVRNVPLDIQHETQIPGGYANASLVLPRPPDLHADDAKLFAEVELYDDHGTFYEGDIVGTPQVGENIRLDLTGPVNRLDDDQTYRRLWIDRDLSRWGEPSLARRVTLASGPDKLSIQSRSGFAETDSPTPPGIVQSINRLDATSWISHELGEAWYSANGLLIGSLRFSYHPIKDIGSANWINRAQLAADDDAGAKDYSATYNTTPSGDVILYASDERRFALVQMIWPTTFEGDGHWEAQWRNLRVVGLFSEPTAGSAPNDGFYAQDLIAEMLTDVGIDYSTGENGSLEPSSIVVLQAAFLEPTTRRKVIEYLTGAGSPPPYLNDWGVYDGEFFWKTPGTYGRTWIVRDDENARLESTGPDSSQRCNGVVVTWRDASGKTHTAGPPGSGADVESAQLQDTDPTNPANRRGRVWRPVDVGIQSGSSQAITLGAMRMSEMNRLVWRGHIDLTGMVETVDGLLLPARHVRGGDRVIVASDHHGYEHPIVQTGHQESTQTCRAHVGAPPETFPAIMGQLQQVGGGM